MMSRVWRRDWLADLRVRTKITVVAACALLTTLAVAGAGVHEAGRLNDTVNTLNHRNVSGLNQLNAVQVALADVILNGVQARRADAPSRRELLLRENAAIASVDRAFEQYSRTPVDSPQWRALVENFSFFWTRFRQLSQTLQSAPPASDDYSHAANKYSPSLNEVKEAVGDLAAYERAAADAMSARSLSTYHSALAMIGGVFLLGLLLAALLIRAVARAIVLPLREVQQVLSAVADGDLSRRARVRGRDEMGVMAGSVNRAGDSIRKTLQELEAVHSQLRHQASHDGLTGLANRRAFEERLRSVLERGELVSMVLIDLDDFKGVNDTLGHLVGDQLLVSVCDRLRGTVRSDDLVARLGGDEFAILLFGDSAIQPEAVLARIVEAFHRPVTAGEHRLPVGCSLGTAQSWPGADATELVRRADVAMYAAKSRGKGFGVRYDATLETPAVPTPTELPGADSGADREPAMAVQRGPRR